MSVYQSERRIRCQLIILDLNRRFQRIDGRSGATWPLDGER